MNLFQPKPPPYEYIKVETKQNVDWLTLNRPESLNAMNPEMMLELQHYFESLLYHQEIRIIVLKAEGRAFCAGYDLSKEHAVSLASGPEGIRVQQRVSRIVKLMRDCPQPIISIVQGAACGGGFALALASDIRLVTPNVKMNAAFIKIGLSGCDVGVSYMLPRLVGASIASELLLTGDFLHADRAKEIGLVSRIGSIETLHIEANNFIEKMLNTSPMGLRLTKSGLNANIDANSMDSAIALEDRQQILCSMSEDHKEGIDAFINKRPPNFKDQ